ncbi:MAG TPA: 4'-phosphopantetheinyl transferase superfamily protein [Catenuloplanes sp.]|jgi:4'-phosphopantetheinyl transferase
MSAIDSLQDQDVHVWQGTSAAHTRYADWALLSVGERARWRSQAVARAATFAASHAAVRRILGHYLTLAPALVELERTNCETCGRTEAGRPVVRTVGRPLWFSLSHSGDQWLFAVSRHPVGVDIEQVRKLDVDAVQELALSAAERRALSTHGPARRNELFFRCWTRKEALLKASGGARLADLRDLDVSPETGTDIEIRSPHAAWPGRWRVLPLQVGAGRQAAVATPAGRAERVVHRWWPVTPAGRSSAQERSQ